MSEIYCVPESIFKVTFHTMGHKPKKDQEPRPIAKAPEWLKQYHFATGSVRILIASGPRWKDVQVGDTWKVRCIRVSDGGKAIYVSPVKLVRRTNANSI